MSDWESIRELIVHGYSRDEKDAARAAIEAGVNMEMVSQIYRDHLPELVARNQVSETTINELVAPVLRVKFRLGLFEHPYARSTESPLLAKEHLQSARQLAMQSVVLLKNKGGLLPLDREKVKTIAVIGPLADDKNAQLGAWRSTASKVIAEPHSPRSESLRVPIRRLFMPPGSQATWISTGTASTTPSRRRVNRM